MATDTLTLGTATVGLTTDAPVTLSLDDRRRHVHVIGKTGTGKSTLLLSLMLQDLQAGRGLAFLDPHGDQAKALIDAMPPERINDCLYLDPADRDFPFAFNPLDGVAPDSRALVTANVVAAFKHLWSDSWGPRLEHILMNSIALLLHSPNTTLLGIPRLLVDERWRDVLLSHCSNPIVRHFWTREISQWGDGFTAEALSPVQNKIGALLAPDILRNIIGQPRSTIHLLDIMDKRRVLIANLSKAALGEGPAHLLGAFLASSFAQAAEARAAIPEERRVEFTLYVDEFQNFATESFGHVLSEARKWRLSLTLAHQFFAQVPPSLRQAVLGNVGSIIAFRVGADDAETVARELGIESPSALTDLPNFSAWMKLIRDGNPTNAIRVDTHCPTPPHDGSTDAVIRQSRARYTRPRATVEARIEKFLAAHDR
jgi:hypothetical protein